MVLPFPMGILTTETQSFKSIEIFFDTFPPQNLRDSVSLWVISAFVPRIGAVSFYSSRW